MKSTDIKLIEYLLGNIQPINDQELELLLKKPETKQELAILSESLKLISNDLPPIQPARTLKSRIIATLGWSAGKKFHGYTERMAQFFRLPHTSARKIMGTVHNLKSPKWKKARQNGIWLQHLKGGDGLAMADCGLVHLDPGVKIPTHEHLGDEWMFVIDGFATTDRGERLSPGDLLHSEAGSEHALQVDEDHACIFAVIAHEGIKWKNPIDAHPSVNL